MKTTHRNKRFINIHGSFEDLSDLRTTLNNVYSSILSGSNANSIKKLNAELSFEVIENNNYDESENFNLFQEPQEVENLIITPRKEKINGKMCLIYESKMNFNVK